MNTQPRSTRRLLIMLGMAVTLAAPLGAQTTTGTMGTTGSATGGTMGAGTATGTDAAAMGASGTQTTSTTTMSTMTDTMRTRTEDRGGFPWGLLGLLGLLGLMKRQPKDTVVHRDAGFRDTTTTTGRPGDPNYRA